MPVESMPSVDTLFVCVFVFACVVLACIAVRAHATHVGTSQLAVAQGRFGRQLVKYTCASGGGSATSGMGLFQRASSALSRSRVLRSRDVRARVRTREAEWQALADTGKLRRWGQDTRIWSHDLRSHASRSQAWRSRGAVACVGVYQMQTQTGIMRLRGGVIFEPWELNPDWSDYGPRFNITHDILDDWDKEKEEAWERMCSEELEEHWKEQRERRQRDVESGDIGCNYVAEDEWCLRGVDGNVYKFKYDPKPYDYCGPMMFPERMPVAVDKVNPDAFADIARDLDRRDEESINMQKEIHAEAERQNALIEALSWYNGSKRVEYEEGKIVWWRNVNKNATQDKDIYQRMDALIDTSDEEQWTNESRTMEEFPDLLDRVLPPTREPPGPFRHPGERVRGVPAPDFSGYEDYSGRLYSVPPLDLRTYARAGGMPLHAIGLDDTPAHIHNGSSPRFVPQSGQILDASQSGRTADASALHRNVTNTTTAAQGPEQVSTWPSNNHAHHPPGPNTGPDMDLGRIDLSQNATKACQGFVWDSLGEELRSCVWRGKLKFVKELIALGVDVNYRTVYAGWRPLHYAAWNDYPEIAQELVRAGAYIDVQTDYGETALHLAAATAATKCIPALLEAGCNTELRHIEGLTPLEVAHKRMLCCEYPTSMRIKDAVLLLAEASHDEAAKEAALEDAELHWVPMPGFAS